MEMRKLGSSDLHITRVGYGAWAIGGSGWQFVWGSQDDNDSIAAIHRALELGVNWIDTAAVYGLGHSEEVVGRALKDWCGSKPYVFTKCGLRENAKGEVQKVLSSDSIRGTVEDSLRRLSVDAIDLYQIHWPPDPDSAALEEGWSTLADLKREGKVCRVGVSNFNVQQLRRAQAIAPVTSLQARYSLVHREIENVTTGSTLPVAGQEGTDETVIQKATEQFDHSPLQTISLGNGLFVFSGDGGNVTAIVDNGSTLLIDSGIDSRAVELNDAVFKATMRPVTRLVNTHWHFDHTGGNVFLGSSGVTIIAQENVKRQLSSVQDVPFIGLRDGHYPPQALPTVAYSKSMALGQGSQRLTLANYGPAHTDGDTIIYIVPANVVVVGDIFSNTFYPIIDLVSGGSIDGLILSIDRILAQTDEGRQRSSRATGR